jgi:hypothetical protein
MVDGGNFSIKVDGLEELEALLQRAGDRSTEVLTMALVQEMQLVFRESQKLVPVGKTGNLKSSGRQKAPVIKGETVSITLGYGGAARKYAAVVHQWPRTGINWTKSGTQSHFLSDPLTKRMPDIEQNIRRRIEGMLST